MYPIIGKYAFGSLGISSPNLGFHFAPILGGVGGNPESPEAVSNPDPINAFPSGRFDKTEEREGTSEAATATGAASALGAMADGLWELTIFVSGVGREARAGDERRRVERWDWVMIDV